MSLKQSSTANESIPFETSNGGSQIPQEKPPDCPPETLSISAFLPTTIKLSSVDVPLNVQWMRRQIGSKNLHHRSYFERDKKRSRIGLCSSSIWLKAVISGQITSLCAEDFVWTKVWFSYINCQCLSSNTYNILEIHYWHRCQSIYRSSKFWGPRRIDLDALSAGYHWRSSR